MQNKTMMTWRLKITAVICVLPKFVCWKTHSYCNDIRKWDLGVVIRSWWWRFHEWDLNNIIYHIRDSESSVAPHYIKIQGEACDLEEGPHATTRAPWSQTSSFQNSENQISVVSKPPNLWYFVIAAQLSRKITIQFRQLRIKKIRYHLQGDRINCRCNAGTKISIFCPILILSSHATSPVATVGGENH